MPIRGRIASAVATLPWTQAKDDGLGYLRPEMGEDEVYGVHAKDFSIDALNHGFEDREARIAGCFRQIIDTGGIED